jgi:4-hydroxy-tetrahydrodipicolinate synthase
MRDSTRSELIIRAMFEGTYTAVVTPFTTSGVIDWSSFDRILADQLAGDVAGIVPCGTTGESPTLSSEEQRQVIARTVSAARGKGQVIAGVGSASTAHACELAKQGAAAGANAVMVVVPYYNKPTQDGLVRHFVAAAKSVSVPIVIYNIPGRSGVDLGVDAMGRILEAAPNVVATKEATGNVVRAQQLAARFGDRLTILSGDDALTLPMIAVGAKGVISVASNVMPSQVAHATKLALSGDIGLARAAHLRLLPFFEALFIETGVASAKALLAHRGLCENVLREPMTPLGDAAKKALFAAYEGLAK